MNENVETLLRRMWDTRPVRLPRSQSPRSWFFGVCEGIAVRYQVSPVLVRLVVGLSVAVGGLGLWFYLTALLVLPRYGAPLAPVQILLKNDRDPRYDADRAMGVRTLIVIVVLLLIGGLGSGGITVGGVLGGVLATGVVWWLLHQRLEVPPAGLQIPSPDVVGSTGSPAYAGADLESLTPAEGFTQPQASPPSWDPLGTAPFAWDLPEPPADPVDRADPAGPEGSGSLEGLAGSEEQRSLLGVSDSPGAADLPGAAGPGAQHPFVTGSRPRSSWRRLGGVLLGVLLALILAVVTGASLLVGGVLHGQGEDSDTTSIRKFTGAAVTVDSLGKDRLVKALFSDIDIDLTAASFPKGMDSVKITVDARFSSVDVVVPEKTSGPSYRIQVDCARVTASDADCSALDEVIVPSRSATRVVEPEHTLILVVEASMSSVRTLQHAAP